MLRTCTVTTAGTSGLGVAATARRASSGDANGGSESVDSARVACGICRTCGRGAAARVAETLRAWSWRVSELPWTARALVGGRGRPGRRQEHAPEHGEGASWSGSRTMRSQSIGTMRLVGIFEFESFYWTKSGLETKSYELEKSVDARWRPWWRRGCCAR